MKLSWRHTLEKKTRTKVGLLLSMFLVIFLYNFQSNSPQPPVKTKSAESDIQPQSALLPELKSNTVPKVSAQPTILSSAQPVPKFHDIQYAIASGDTLEGIFTKKHLPLNDLYNILEADEPYLVIDVLQPGDQLTFRLDNNNQLQALSLNIDPSKTVIYQRSDDGNFEYKESLTPTRWVTDVVHGDISGSFYVSARKAGLTDNTVMLIDQLLKNTLNFRRDLRMDDHFDVVIKRQTVKGKPIGNNSLLAVRLRTRRDTYSAYLHKDGSYYDAKGNNLTPALLRYPTRHHFRISSNFNPWRLNPVTKRYAPHNGVDFAAPLGTPVISTGDGRITRIAVHRFAGKYVVVDEFGPYSTRYLHLSKILVHKGQRVKRGEVIGLSGNTGRSTGPHLHYELDINGKPVNPMTAKIPLLKSVSRRDIAAYRKQVHTLQAMMDGDIEVAQAGEKKQSKGAQHSVTTSS